MEEKELINKIKELKEIKPSQNWVNFTKVRILGEEPKNSLVSVLEFFPSLVYKHSRLAFASLIIFGFVAGFFGFAQGALPGDPIYALKIISEKTRLAFVSENDLLGAQLELANKRLEELKIITQANQVKKIAPAVQEFQANALAAAKGLTETQNPNIEQIVSETKKIKENREKIESLGVVVGETKEFDEALSQLVGRELKDFGSRTLTDEQRTVLVAAAEDFWAGRYSESLENILLLGN
jgi:hypothetical protein